jgi:hypothetical protein
MRSDAREWSFPEPLRALLWWPGISFAVAIIAPEAAVWAIIASGLALASGGVLVPAVARRLRRHVPQAEPPLMEIPQVKTAA